MRILCPIAPTRIYLRANVNQFRCLITDPGFSVWPPLLAAFPLWLLIDEVTGGRALPTAGELKVITNFDLLCQLQQFSALGTHVTHDYPILYSLVRVFYRQCAGAESCKMGFSKQRNLSNGNGWSLRLI